MEDTNIHRYRCKTCGKTFGYLPPFFYPYKWYALPRIEKEIAEILRNGLSYVKATPAHLDVKTIYRYTKIAAAQFEDKRQKIQSSLVTTISGYESIKDPRLRHGTTVRSSYLRIEMLVAYLKGNLSELAELSPMVLLNYLDA